METISKPWGILFLTVLFSSAGQFLLKIGVQRIGGIRLSGSLLDEGLKILTSPWLMAGFGAYFFSAYLTLMALSRVELSLFSLFTCLNFVLILFASYFFLHESFSFLKTVGCILTIVGVYLISSN